MRSLVFFALSLACFSSSANAETSAEQCARFAASPLEKGHERSGIAFDKIDLSKALAPCIEAASSPAATPMDHYRLSLVYYVAHEATLAASEAATSADANYPPGMYNYALLLKDGDGVARDEPAAVRLLAKAAQMGFVEAETALGEMIWSGQGVSQNKQLGRQWLVRAAKHGSASAANSLKQIAKIEAENQRKAPKAVWGVCKRGLYDQAIRDRQNFDGRRSSMDNGLTTGLAGPDGTCE
jgi:TPR repeat protein